MYATTQQATAFHAARLSGGAWSALSEDTQAAALQEASDAMDAYALTQGGWRGDYSASVPEALVRACSMEALSLTDGDTAARRRLQMQGVKSTSIGSASESYGDNQPGAGALLSPKAEQLLRPYLKRAGQGVHIL